MVSALSFPHRRPRQSDSHKNKTPHRPPPLKLEESFFQLKDKKKSGEPAVKAVRGEAPDPNPNKEAFTIPMKMEISLSNPTATRRPRPMESPRASGALLSDRDQWSVDPRTPEASILADTRPVSPQESLRTIIQLDGHEPEEDPNISPLSEGRPPVRTGSALSKFFPELSNNFSVVSPINDPRKLSVPERPAFRKPSFYEDEMYERVQTLYSLSADAASDDEFQYHYEQKTSSSSGSDEIQDDASSCYSRRSSVTSVGTEAVGAEEKVYNSADAFSIISPAAAGVFDDASSICPSIAPSRARSRSRSRAPSRAPSRASSSGPSKAPSRASTKASRPPPHGQAELAQLPRSDSLTSPMTLDDLKNKPLPLEPVREPSPLAIRRESRSISTDRSAFQHIRQPPQRRSEMQHSTSMHWPPPQQPCHSCGGCGERSARRDSRRDASAAVPEGRRSRNGPTLSQAAEDLEDTLAGLGRSAQRKQQTMLILDAPLQVRRHNGEWVASRPAPMPPSGKPYSGSHVSSPLESARTLKKDKHGRTIKSKRSAETPKDRRPSNLDTIREDPGKAPVKENGRKKSQINDATEIKMAKLPKGRQASSPATLDEARKDKNKRSFITMPTFSRRNSQPVRSMVLEQRQRHDSQQEQKQVYQVHHEHQGPRGQPEQIREAQRVSVLSAHSEASSGPPPEAEDPEQLSQSAQPNPSNAPPAPAPNKREDLLLQLPRLQTHDLGLKSVLERFSFDQGPRRSIPASPTDPAGADSTRGEASLPSGDLHNLTPPEDEKIPVATDKMRQNQAFVSTAQASSVRLPPDQVYELAATPPSPSLVIPELPEQNNVSVSLSFPVDVPEGVVVSIMESIGSLDDLFNLVLVNKRFYTIFKKRELPMIKNALFKMSRPAWELREMSPPWDTEWQQVLDPDTQVPEYTPSLYLDRYAQDIFALAQLKSMILVRCTPFLRRDTIRGLSGVDSIRAEEVDDAFWRIWTFCRIFGMGKGRENDMEGQRDWLKGGVKAKQYLAPGSSMTEPFGMNNVLFEPPPGFALGNHGGLSPKQLYDMTEIWTCLAVLLQPLHGKCAEARRVGIFDGMNAPEGDSVREETVLEEWTSWVLTLGLSAVLTLSSLSPAEATAATFKKAKEAGLTKWELTETETSRCSFLKEAVSRVYEDQERSLASDSDTVYEEPLSNPLSREQDRERQQAFSLELRARKLRGAENNRELPTSFSDERPMSEFSTIVHNLNGTVRDAPPVPPVPALILDRSSTSSGSTAPRTPNHTPPPPSHSPDPSIPFPRSPPLHPTMAPTHLQPQVLDPVDRAMQRLVGQLGFNQDDVKWALKITDTGEGIDVEAAEQLLKQQKKRQDRNPFAPRGKQSLLMSVMKRQGSQDSGWRWAA